MTNIIRVAAAEIKRNPTFNDRIILITGATQGIGRALALELARRGATIILMARDQSRLETIYDQIVAEGGAIPVIVSSDLNTLKAVDAEELAEHIMDTFGQLDGIAHVAGLLGGREPIQSHRPEKWNQVLNINLNAVFYLTRALLPCLEHSPNGRIVFATSSVGHQVAAYWGAYAVSKAGLEMFAGMLAQELQNTSNTRVITVNPGGTRTKMRAEAKPGEDPKTLPSPNLVSNAFLFGLTEKAGAFNGDRINARDLMTALGTWPQG